jgi:hypothetical protein
MQHDRFFFATKLFTNAPATSDTRRVYKGADTMQWGVSRPDTNILRITLSG